MMPKSINEEKASTYFLLESRKPIPLTPKLKLTPHGRAADQPHGRAAAQPHAQHARRARGEGINSM